MSGQDLKQKPLVEAIFELRWRLAETSPGMQADPNYKVLLGRLFERIQTEYSAYEALPTASMPDEFVAYTPQHRLRKSKGGWPLVQLGPGLLTYNDTEGYDWQPFKAAAVKVVERFFDAYPDSSNIVVTSLVLRFIDAVDFDFESSDLFDFLKKLKIDISLPSTLFTSTGVDRRPNPFSWVAAFKSNKPLGRLTLKLATGNKENKNALIWETTVETSASDIPQLPQGFADWAQAAHDVANKWFFTMIEGELKDKFTNG